MNKIITIIGFIVMIIIISTNTHAIYNELSVQGKLTNSSTGNAQVGDFAFSFNIYNDYTGGASLYESNQTLTIDSNGIYNAILKDVDLAFDVNYYLGVNVNDTGEMSPRINMTDTGNAIRSNETEYFNNQISSYYLNTSTAFGGDISGTYNAISLSTDSVSDNEIDYSTVTLTDFTNDASFVTTSDDSISSSELDSICNTNDRILLRAAGTWGCFDYSVWATDSEVTATNTSMKNYVDAQDVAYNDSIKIYIDAQDISYNTSLKTYVDVMDSAQDACSEITGCIENAITDGNTNWDNSYGFITNTVNDLTNYYTKTIIDSLGNWSNDKDSYWNTANDLDTVIATDEITESKIDFNTVCGVGNHIYINGNNLACEADDDTTYTAGTGLELSGTVFSHNDTSSQSSSDNSGRTYIQDILLDTYGHITSITTATETVTNTDTQDLSYDTGTDVISLVDGGSIDITEVDTDTNASTACSASQFLEGDGTCADVIEEGELDSLSELDTQIGTTGTASSSTYLRGDNSWVTPTDTNTNANTECSGTTTYYDGEGNCDDISSVYAPINYGDDWNKTYADTLYRLDSWNNFTGIPTAAPTDGDTTHLSTADQIRDYVIGLGYSATTGTVTSVATDDTYLTGGAITTTGTITFNTALAGTDLAVNSSDYWDNLGSVSDINAADITDDGTYRLSSWNNFTGIPTATPSNDDTTHLSTADHIYDYIVGLSYVANAWDALSDMTLAEDNVYVGNGNPTAVALPDCDDASGNHLNYDTETNAFSCGTSDSYASGDDAIPDCTAVNACTIDAESMEGTDWGTMANGKWCIYDSTGTEVDCNVEPVVNTDTQDLSYDAGTDVISLTNGGSIDITEVDTNTQLSEATVDSYANNNNYLDLDTYPNADTDSTDDLLSANLNTLAKLDTQIGTTGTAGATTFLRGDNSWVTPTDTNTNANTVCSGDTTYMDGEGNCDDISGVYQPLEATLTDIADGTIAENLINTANPWADDEVSNTLTCSDLVSASAVVDISTETNLAVGDGITKTGDTLTVVGGTSITADTGGVSVTADSIGDTQLTYNTGQALTTASNPTFQNVTVERVLFENDATNHGIRDNATCIIITGDTVTWNIC